MRAGYFPLVLLSRSGSGRVCAGFVGFVTGSCCSAFWALSRDRAWCRGAYAGSKLVAALLASPDPAASRLRRESVRPTRRSRCFHVVGGGLTDEGGVLPRSCRSGALALGVVRWVGLGVTALVGLAVRA